MRNRIVVPALLTAAALAAVAGCSSDSPTNPVDVGRSAAVIPTKGKPAPSGDVTGERIFGNAAIEPAFNADSGEPMYLLTPINAPLPSKANSHAVSPLYIVAYPSGSTALSEGEHFNCEGVPGNCPDHDGLVATTAVNTGATYDPDLYGDDPGAVPGHDHVADPPGKPDFNIAWEVVEVVFTNATAANTRLTTDAQIDAAVEAGDAVLVDLGFAFNCNVVPEALYWRGQPVGGSGG